MRDLEYGLQDCLAEIRDAADSLEYDPGQLEQVEERIDQLYRLSLKYGSTEEEMLAFLENSRKELHSIELSDERAEELAAEYEKYKEEAIQLAKELSSGRRKAAAELVRRVREELSFLDMPNVEFQVEQIRCPLNHWGCDKNTVFALHQPWGARPAYGEDCFRRRAFPHHAGYQDRAFRYGRYCYHDLR